MTNYWYMDMDSRETVSPIFNRLSDLKEWNKQHRKAPRNASELIIDGKCIIVAQCQDKMPSYKGNSKF